MPGREPPRAGPEEEVRLRDRIERDDAPSGDRQLRRVAEREERELSGAELSDGPVAARQHLRIAELRRQARRGLRGA